MGERYTSRCRHAARLRYLPLEQGGHASLARGHASRKRPVKAAYQIVCAREIVCPLICKLMSKRHDGHSAFGSGATAAMDYG